MLCIGNTVLKKKKKNVIMYLESVGWEESMRGHSACAEVRGQLVGVGGPFLLPCGFEGYA